MEIWRIVTRMIPEYPETHNNFHRQSGQPEDLDGFTDDEGNEHPFIAPDVIPGYGTAEKITKVPSGQQDPTKFRDEHLIEYFANYADSRCTKFRRFYVIHHGPMMPHWNSTFNNVSLAKD